MLRAATSLRSVDDSRRLFVAIDLTALRILHPPFRYDLSYRDTFGRIWVEHLQIQLSHTWRVDVVVEELDVRVV